MQAYFSFIDLIARSLHYSFLVWSLTNLSSRNLPTEDTSGLQINNKFLLFLSAYSRLDVPTADISIFITRHLLYGRMLCLPPTLSTEGKLSHLSST